MNKHFKNKAIIFDFLRTLYDPEEGTFYPKVEDMLQTLALSFDLYVITREEKTRKGIIEASPVVAFFRTIIYVQEKTVTHFQSIFPEEVTYESIYVVGDRVTEEIMIGNKLGWKTIWVKQGKFKDLIPVTPEEIPWKTISSISDIASIL